MIVRQFLTERRIPFTILGHNPTYTAQHLAQAVHVSGDEVAKTVLLKADREFVLAVLQATHRIDMAELASVLGAEEVELATEEEFASIFPDFEPGAVPPLGSQYGMKTLVDRPLIDDESIVFEGNTHSEAIRMSYEDFEDLESPIVGSFTFHE